VCDFLKGLFIKKNTGSDNQDGESGFNICEFIKGLFQKKNMVSGKYFEKDLKSLNKNDIIKLIILESGRINHNEGLFFVEDKKFLREFSKRHLIKTLMILKTYKVNKVKKILVKIAKEKINANTKTKSG
jgi:hypothetical protein